MRPEKADKSSRSHVDVCDKMLILSIVKQSKVYLP